MSSYSGYRGRRPPPVSSTSASNLIEALKEIEKNPFSMNNAMPNVHGQSIVDPNALRMTRPIGHGINNVMEVSRQTKQTQSPSGIVRKIPIDSYSGNVNPQESLLSASLPRNVDHENSGIQQTSNSFQQLNRKQADLLSNKKKETFSTLRKIEKKEESLFQETVNIVPPHMLVKHGMFDLIKGKQMDKVVKLLCKMRLQLLAQGLFLWHKHAKVMTTAMFGTAAIIVHRVARGFLGRRRVKRIYKEIRERERNRDKPLAVAMMNKGFKVIMIQSCIRRFLAERIVAKERRHRKSIIKVQRFYKTWRNNGLARKAFEQFMVLHFSAKIVQRVWRGIQGRKKARYAQVLRHRLERQGRYESPEGLFEFYFEQHGAAVCIQKWYGNLPCVTALKERARMMKRKKQLDLKIYKIQRIVRMFIKNRRLVGKFEAQQLKNKYNIRPRQMNRLIRAQAAIRGYLTQKKNKVLFASILAKREKRRRGLELGVSERHRKTNRFENLKIGNLRNIVRLDRKAIVIQRWYKSCRMLRYFYGMINNRRQLIADRIRTWFRTWRYRRQLKVALFYIQPLWKRAVKKFLLRKYAQVTISRRYKAYRAMKWFRDWQRMRNRMASRIQYCVLRMLRGRERRVVLGRMRFEQELLCSGQQLFEKTSIYNYIDEICRRMMRTKAPIPKFELQLFFMSYCPNAQIDVAKGSKLIKESPGLATAPHLTLKELEMIFAKVKGAANGSALDYSQFLQYLFYIACVKYISVDASTLPLANKINHNTENKKERVKLELSLKNRSIVEAFTFGRLSGRKALLTKIVYDYISKNPTYKLKDKALDNKSAVFVSARTVDDALNSIQRMFKVIILRMGLYRVRQIVQAKKRQEKRVAGSIIIQAFCRRYLGRRRCVRLSQRMYLKYIDHDTSIPFWTNSHSGTSFWTKPLLLRELDCGDGIMLPEEREQYTPPCRECDENTAACFCQQCGALYCNVHFSSIHTSGARKTHDCIKLDMCVECTFQVPTKRCLTCDELYCDTCFRFVHRRGRSRLHTFSWVTPNCYFCDERAAHWRRIDSWNGYEEEFICTIDFWKEFDCDPKTFVDPTGRYTVCAVDYTGPSVLAWRQCRENEEVERIKREAYKRQQEELAEKMRQAAVVSIQRVYRGVRVRRSIGSFVAERKEFFRLRAIEFPQREVWQYKLAATHGRAKALEYDTNKEKVLRKYPVQLHETVTHCIERKWGLMSELLVPTDLGDLAPKNLEAKERIATYLALQKSKMALQMARNTVTSRERTHAKCRERYRLARSSATTKEPKKKALQLAANKASKNVDKAKIKVNDAIDSHTFARHKYEYFTGPKDLQNLVAKRRETGVPMPFSVDLVYKSRYAVVRYDRPSTDATVSDNLFLPKPGKWRCKIKIGNILKIHGMHFTVVEDVEDLIDIREQLEIELRAEKEAEIARLAEEERVEKEKLRRDRLRKSGGVYSSVSGDDSESVSVSMRSGGTPSVMSVLQQKQKGGGLVDENDTPFSTELICITDEEDIKLLKRERKSFEEGSVTERIKLDRPWLFADMVLQDVHLVTTKPPLSRRVFNASRSIHNNSAVQRLASFDVLLLHKRCRFWKSLAKAFDDESTVGMMLMDNNRNAARKRNNNMKMCRSQVDLEYQFRVKDRLLYGFKVVYGIPKQMIAAKYARYKLNQEYKLLSPYRRWERSDEKSEIKVIMESGTDTSDTLGYMMMDTDAPLDVARDYIQRNFRMELNDICGSAFQFFAKNRDGTEDLVPVSAEEDRWSTAYLKETKREKGTDSVVSEHTDTAPGWCFYLTAQGGQLDHIDEGNLSDEDDILGGDDGSLSGF